MRRGADDALLLDTETAPGASGRQYMGCLLKNCQMLDNVSNPDDRVLSRLAGTDSHLSEVADDPRSGRPEAAL